MSKLDNLSGKIAVVIAAALATIHGVNKQEEILKLDEKNDNSGNIRNYSSKIKPMPVLKMNLLNPENSQFVASHTSHSSHRSHSSHYSHRSGAMFS